MHPNVLPEMKIPINLIKFKKKSYHIRSLFNLQARKFIAVFLPHQKKKIRDKNISYVKIKSEMGIKRLPDSPYIFFFSNTKGLYQFQHHISIWIRNGYAYYVLCVTKKSFSLNRNDMKHDNVTLGSILYQNNRIYIYDSHMYESTHGLYYMYRNGKQLTAVYSWQQN